MAGAHRINKDKVASRIINGEAVLLNLDNGFYYSLNKTGSEVWQYLEDGKAIDEIIILLKKIYSLDEKKLKKDVESLINDLVKEELISR